jgi:genome maintenance exonuclease 1|tara:strand:- start:1644 stop:2306 length:663 start_codon:yes stop_codon:yes gene_type:complete
MFNHCEINVAPLKRVNIKGTRYYKVGDQKLPSITSITSHKSRKSIAEWRRKVGAAEANKISRRAASRGTDTHTITEYYLKNLELPEVQPLSDFLFKISKPFLNNLDNIYALEKPLYSLQLGVAGTVDCIAEYNGELSIVDFKTSKEPKPREWIEGYFVQAAAYACMLYELTGLTVKKLVIIMSCENGECEVYEEYNKSKFIRLLMQYIKDWKAFNETTKG